MNQSHFIDPGKEKESFATGTLINVLEQLTRFQENSCLQIVHNSAAFFVHLDSGQLIYSTNLLLTVRPFLSKVFTLG